MFGAAPASEEFIERKSVSPPVHEVRIAQLNVAACTEAASRRSMLRKMFALTFAPSVSLQGLFKYGSI